MVALSLQRAVQSSCAQRMDQLVIDVGDGGRVWMTITGQVVRLGRLQRSKQASALLQQTGDFSIRAPLQYERDMVRIKHFASHRESMTISRW